jgi:hypothetical protein
MEINGDALRRETGFEDADKPTDDELKEQALKVIIKTLPSGAGSALSTLIGEPVEIRPVAAQAPGQAPRGRAPEPEPEPAERGAPATSADGPPGQEARQAAAAARQERMVQQAQALHAVRFATGRPPELLHPALCSQHAYSCPFTHAALKLHSLPRPGASGVYEARLDAFGRFTIGKHSPLMDVSGFFSTTRSSHGHAHSRR